MPSDIELQEKFANGDADKQMLNIWNFTQRGLVYPSPHARFVSFWLKQDTIDKPFLADLMDAIYGYIQTLTPQDSNKSKYTSAVLGVSLRLAETPFGVDFTDPTKAIDDSRGIYKNSGADLWFHIKSDDESDCRKVSQFIQDALKDKLDTTKPHAVVEQHTATKSTASDLKGGKLLGSRFSENLNSPSDPISLRKHIIIGPEKLPHIGGSFVLSQRFIIDWTQLHQSGESDIEKIIGRKTDDTIIAAKDTKSHIKSSRVHDDNGNTTPVMRLGLPFERSKITDLHLLEQGANIGDERGIYFAGYSKNLVVLQRIIDSQVNGDTFIRDRLFNSLRSNLGGFFYIPSTYDLGLYGPGSEKYVHYKNLSQWRGIELGNTLYPQWRSTKADDSRQEYFPGVDWDRLDRHYCQKSKSPYMFYNHQHYLWTMATASGDERAQLEPPSVRVLSLLENMFSRWQDTWYKKRKQEEIKALTAYRDDPLSQGMDIPSEANIEHVPLIIRKALVTRLTLRLYTEENYGFRGEKLVVNSVKTTFYGGSCPTEGKLITGADTFRIQSDEIIVGGMPNLSLGQGRYVMRYLSEDERIDAFTKGLSEASGVGHVVPGYDKLLVRGINGLRNKVNKKLIKLDPSRLKRSRHKNEDATYNFYQACLITLDGISDYCSRYSSHAYYMAGQIQDKIGLKQEYDNLIEIGERMGRLSTDSPQSFIDGLQLIFVVHCCLHLTGEPTALGRLDQWLYELYKQDIDSGKLTPSKAQEAIDAFCIKLAEKVQLNRMMVEDHQPYGNLAMGGTSGAYPQGAGINQWVQQLTLGGVNDKGELVCNELTLLFLKSIRRLPLNAPCISLRVSAKLVESAESKLTGLETPEQKSIIELHNNILKEAAKAILSGGAHPILLNDDKIIDGLKASGDDIGYKNHPLSPETLQESARNYACDGCYEPQYPGENWFALGVFSSLKPLECALNYGKTYASAGVGYLAGRQESYIDDDATTIQDYPELEELYIKHFKALYIKSCVSQLKTLGANVEFCPAPLLSLFVADCIEKGKDFYDGGPRYHIFAPCFIGLSSAINSLYAIQIMVFNEATAVTSLAELRECLICDWGFKMTEPFASTLAPAELQAKSERFKRLRQIALQQPRYGRGHKEIDQFGNKLIATITEFAVDTFKTPNKTPGSAVIQKELKILAEKFSIGKHSFELQIQPGVGTFENHVEMGAENGASADGRRCGETIASDLSAAPSPSDLAPNHQEASFTESLESLAKYPGLNNMTDGAPTDFNIREDFPEENLVEIIKQFARGDGSNILTVTVASPETLAGAMNDPERYNLVRVRTGGWSEHYAAMFPDKQEQHRRRPLSTANTEGSKATAKPYTSLYGNAAQKPPMTEEQKNTNTSQTEAEAEAEVGASSITSPPTENIFDPMYRPLTQSNKK